MSTSAALKKQAEAMLYPVTCRLICAVSRPHFFCRIFGSRPNQFLAESVKMDTNAARHVFRPPETRKKQYDSSVFCL
jgi:hypothetical protein